MMRTKELFVSVLNSNVPLARKRILEIGCGTGNYTKRLAPLCAEIVSVDPDPEAIKQAKENLRIPNVSFRVMSAQNLLALSGKFQVVIFTLSFHHVPNALMNQAINEAIRVADTKGFIVFLEPDRVGSFFEAELKFQACDGDEREAKSRAYHVMLGHPRLMRVAELPDLTEFHWDSLKDFIDTMHPRENLPQLEPFLLKRKYTLSAKRRINIFKIKSAG